MAAARAAAHAGGMATSIVPESRLERELLADPALQAGLVWGPPRSGHPEGSVADHVAAMLAGIGDHDDLRSDLRFLAIVHDAFKAQVGAGEPWSPENDHAMLARRFATGYTSDERLLATLERHDEAYWIWRTADDPEGALQRLLDELPDLTLFARFVELDAANEGKDLTFLWWFRRRLALAGRSPAHPPAVDGEPGDDVLYVKAFATAPERQAAIAQAAVELVAEQQPKLRGRGEVLSSDDGLRVWLQWRWRGSRRELIERDADFVREALAAHPVFAEARAVEARLFRMRASGQPHGRP
jgi:hypothetical protein